MADTPDTLRIRNIDWLAIECYYAGTSTALPSIPSGVDVKVVCTATRTDTTYGSAGTAADTGVTPFTVRLTAVDALGASVEIDGGDHVDIPGTNGVATDEHVNFYLGGLTGPITITAVTTATEGSIRGVQGRDYIPTGWIQRDTMIKTLVITQYPSSAIRGSAFTLTVQAQDGNGEIITEATDTITVTLNNTDANDKFTSPTPDAVSYTYDLTGHSGVYTTATEAISGGSGTDNNNTITVSAPGYVSATSPTFTVESELVLSYTILKDAAQIYYGTDSAIPSPYEYLPDADMAAWWANVQGDAKDNYQADTTLANTSYYLAIEQVGNSYDYISSYAVRQGGYISFAITNEQKAAAASARLNLLALARYYSAPYSTAAFYDTAWTSLNIHFSESTSEFANGAALDASTPDYTVTTATLNALQAAVGGTASSPKRISLPIGTGLGTYIKNMTGNTLVLWLNFTHALVSAPGYYYYPLYDIYYTNPLKYDAYAYFSTTTATRPELEIYTSP